MAADASEALAKVLFTWIMLSRGLVRQISPSWSPCCLLTIRQLLHGAAQCQLHTTSAPNQRPVGQMIATFNHVENASSMGQTRSRSGDGSMHVIACRTKGGPRPPFEGLARVHLKCGHSNCRSIQHHCCQHGLRYQGFPAPHPIMAKSSMAGVGPAGSSYSLANAQ